MLVLVLAVMGSMPSGLKEAATALDDLQFEAALEKLPAESARAGATRAELVEWFSVRGLAQLGLKRDAAATETFLQLFSFAPEWQVPDQFGPRVRTVVAAARAEAARRGVVTLRFEAGELIATKDAWGFATGVEVSWRAPGGATQTKRLPLLERQVPPWPRSERLEVWGRVLGLGEATLFDWGGDRAPLVLEPRDVMSVERTVNPPAAGLRPLGVVGLGVGGVGLVAGGVAVALAVASQDAERALADVTRDANGRITSLSQRDAFALDARAKSSADAATACAVSAVVLVVAGAGLVLFDRLTVTPAPGGLGLSLALDANFGVVEASR